MRTNPLKFLVPVLAAALLAGCTSTKTGEAKISRKPFGKAPDGTPVDLYTLRNGNGMEARITNYGGIVTSHDRTRPQREVGRRGAGL